MRMSGLFRSKSCALPPFTRNSPGILKSTSPPTPSRYPHHQDEEDEEQDQEEYDDDDYDYEHRVQEAEEEEEGYFGVKKNHSPATTPFIGSEERSSSSRRHKSSTGTAHHHHRANPDDGQFPPGGLLAIVVAALRKSLLVTCTGLHLDTDAPDDVSASSSNHLDIGWPTDVRHLSHVTFDPFHGFLGLPLDLQYRLPRGNIVPSARSPPYSLISI